MLYPAVVSSLVSLVLVSCFPHNPSPRREAPPLSVTQSELILTNFIPVPPAGLIRDGRRVSGSRAITSHGVVSGVQRISGPRSGRLSRLILITITIRRLLMQPRQPECTSTLYTLDLLSMVQPTITKLCSLLLTMHPRLDRGITSFRPEAGTHPVTFRSPGSGSLNPRFRRWRRRWLQ